MSPKKMIDIGCGDGKLIYQLMKKGWDCSGADLYPWAQEVADELGYKLYRGNIEDQKIPDNTFDLITSTNVIEHIPELLPHLKTLIRILKPGGMLYINVPNYGALPIRMGFSSFFRNKPPLHVNYFTAKSVKKIFSNPVLADHVSTVKCRSYGIPELHRIVFLFKKEKRSKKEKRTAPVLLQKRKVLLLKMRLQK